MFSSLSSVPRVLCLLEFLVSAPLLYSVVTVVLHRWLRLPPLEKIPDDEEEPFDAVRAVEEMRARQEAEVQATLHKAAPEPVRDGFLPYVSCFLYKHFLFVRYVTFREFALRAAVGRVCSFAACARTWKAHPC